MCVALDKFTVAVVFYCIFICTVLSARTEKAAKKKKKQKKIITHSWEGLYSLLKRFINSYVCVRDWRMNVAPFDDFYSHGVCHKYIAAL